jgi:hypothetical protein
LKNGTTTGSDASIAAIIDLPQNEDAVSLAASYGCSAFVSSRSFHFLLSTAFAE